jgi:predicted nucleic acid-binding protein
VSVAKFSSFLDSNVLLYLLSEDPTKADSAEALLKTNPVISVQVLNEVTSVCRRKLAMSWEDIGNFLELVRSFCNVVPLTVDVHDRARQIAERHQISFYDACIAAAAATAGCQVLYTEDLSHGQILEDSLTIRNPFAQG